MKEPIQKYTYLGKTVLLLPGNRFTKNELNSRLIQMDIQYDQSNQTKKYFVNLYENDLKKDVNKQKIFQKLLKDTIYYDSLQNTILKNGPNKIETPTKNNNLQKVSIINNRVISENELTNRQNINNRNINEQKLIFNNNRQNNYFNQTSNLQLFFNNLKKEYQYNSKDEITNKINQNQINNNYTISELQNNYNTKIIK